MARGIPTGRPILVILSPFLSFAMSSANAGDEAGWATIPGDLSAEMLEECRKQRRVFLISPSFRVQLEGHLAAKAAF